MAEEPCDVVRNVIAANCIQCHAGQGPGPFPLVTDGDLVRHGPTMVAAVESGLMPPWLPTGARGVFRDDCRLSPSEITAFSQWKTMGFPLGIPAKKNADAAAVVSVIASPISIDVARDWIPSPEDPEALRSFATALQNTIPLRVRGWKVIRDTPTLVVRYNLLLCDGPEAIALDQSDPGPGFFGNGDRQNKTSGASGAIGIDGTFQLPEGFAFAVPINAALVAEALSSGRGRPEAAGAVFQAIPAASNDRVVQSFPVIPDRSAPALRSNQLVSVTTEPLSAPLDLVGVVIRPDMRARSIMLHVISESGTESSLIDIPRYLPSLDRGYVLQKPLTLQVGDRIRFVVRYDDDPRARRSAPVAVLLVSQPLADDHAPISERETIAAHLSFTLGVAAKDLGIDLLSSGPDCQYLLGKTEITQRQFMAVLKRNPSAFSQTQPNLDRPADSITWFDAAEFCNALSHIEGLPPRYILHGIERESDGCITSARVEITTSHGYRLPRESEWLRTACSDKSKSPDEHGDAVVLETTAWLSPWANNISHPVATKAPNASGFYDLVGNVWEWCEDAWIDSESRGPTARVVRGGAWCDGIAAANCEFRSGIAAGTRNSPFGFRIAVDTPASTSTPQP